MQVTSEYSVKLFIAIAFITLTFWLRVALALAQERTILPPPTDPPFQGIIGLTYKDSTPSFPPILTAPKKAPNVLLVLLDDVGFGNPSTFGGPIQTPTLDRLAKSGLRYNNFHVTALCSPTRAALLTGRNHHVAGTALVVESASGYPGYDEIIPRSTASIAEILRLNGYSTAAFGKWHNVPMWESSIAGPFDHWPTHMGFDYFYGFLGGMTQQYNPNTYIDTTPIEPYFNNKNYYFPTDMANRAIAWIHYQHSVAPDKPFFVYYATGSAHAPHQVPRNWMDLYKGKFDQ
jgi:arylsulfatase A-like enzyme